MQFKKTLLGIAVVAAATLGIAQPALAVKTEFTGITLKNAYVLPINAADLQLALTAADVANGNMFKVLDGGVLIAQNSGASPYTITINAAVDAHGRSGDITTYSLAAGDIVAIWVPSVGVAQTSGTDAGKVYVSATNAAVKFAFLYEPANARAR
jgi:hypothetical protein